MTAVLVALVIAGLSGPLCLGLPRRGLLRDRVFALCMLGSAAIGLPAVLGVLASGRAASLAWSWSLPFGSLSIRLDVLSAAFLVPVFLVPALGAVYALGYWTEAGRPAAAARHRVFYGLLTAALALVMIAQDGVLLLLAWEAMALAAFFLVTLEDENAEVRASGWVYFAATHLGTLMLYALFCLLRRSTGSFALDPVVPGGLDPSTVGALFLLALAGFGLKAGIMPLHVWLPGAHANAPSHVSAVLSGVMLKAGVYGIVRVCWMISDLPTWCAGVLVLAGGVSAVLGIAFACGQRDYKRLLAYSSIENIGVIMLGLGAAVLGRSFALPQVTALAFAGVVLHVWNHALFKPAMFFVAGAVLHATGTRRMNQLGALARLMPWTAAIAALGSVAIAALPPLNGFISEWCLYSAFLHGALSGHGEVAALLTCATALLAVTGSLALAVFVKLHATLFLGQPRSDATRHAHDPARLMLLPMLVLALLCVAIGMAPRILPALLLPVIASWTRSTGADWAAPMLAANFAVLKTIGVITFGTVVLAALLWAWLGLRARPRAEHRPGTWDCGYALPSARMQYTESSFGQVIVTLFQWALLPRRQRPAVQGLFPARTRLETETPDVVLDRGLVPLLRGAARLGLRVRLLQHGQIQLYVLYILVALLFLLLFA
ncbi:MAG: proton-conducting transporter membrane subunit [Planctomycetota bacterium]